MASSQKSAPKPTSRWGFITQAVASVESRLDTILADEDIPARKPTPQPAVLKENAQPSRASMESPRGSTTANDRLQERLARAMAKKNAAKVDSPAGSEPVSRASTPVITSPTPDGTSTAAAETNSEVDIEPVSVPPVEQEDNISERVERVSLEKPAINGAPTMEGSGRPSKDSIRISQDRQSPRPSTDEGDAVLLQAQLEHEDVKSKMQDEIKGYIERIDALNAKLQYLTKEATQSTKQSAVDAEPGSLERKLLEREEKIAVLMEEGQKLSMTEMNHLSIIKKLRAQVSTYTKDQDAVRQRAERAERSITNLEERAKRAENSAKSTEAKLADASRRAQDLENVRREKNALNDTVMEMRAQVAKANARAENAESKVRNEQFEIEQTRITELQNDLSKVKVERESTEERLRQEIKDLKSALEKEKGQGRAMETEMLAEQAALESKLESFRVRAEEASSNDLGDTQAKLLRQIETLQSQYATASQNWQGIEGTLLARITSLEKERDDLGSREADLRRKLRDATSRAKSSEKELEDVQLQYATLQESQSEMQAETQRVNRRTQQLEEDFTRSQKEIEDQKVKLERDYARRLDEEKSKWAASVQLARTEAPSLSTRKSFVYDSNHLGHPMIERTTSRRSSTLASGVVNNDSYSPSRHHSTTSSKNMHSHSVPETPILITSDPDEYFTGVPVTPVSPDHTPSRRGVGDLVSNSTVGAGPSVQLVERMSANVRRLESEKAASKDELARITTQRDESRQEVVRLMREVEQKRHYEQRLKDLEDEHKTLSTRHQTTLELLGEKSEQVEELKADILDVKQMYRDLANHMK